MNIVQPCMATVLDMVCPEEVLPFSGVHDKHFLSLWYWYIR